MSLSARDRSDIEDAVNAATAAYRCTQLLEERAPALRSERRLVEIEMLSQLALARRFIVAIEQRHHVPPDETIDPAIDAAIEAEADAELASGENP